MPEFLVEAYHPTAGPPGGAPGPRDVAVAADRLTREGRPVSLVRSVLVPDDETCFYLFVAGSSEAVLEASGRSGLCFERVVPALSVWVLRTFDGTPVDPAATRDALAAGVDRGGPPLRQ